MSKYPRSFHAPWSEGATSDDKILKSVDSFLNKPLIVSEKIDGSNVTMRVDGVFARSHNGPPTHASFDALKARYNNELKWQLHPGFSYFFEYAWAVHSIAYDQLPDYLFMIGIRDDRDNRWLFWDDVEAIASEFGILTVPILGKIFAKNSQELEELSKQFFSLPGLYGQKEGVVVRNAWAFDDDKFSDNLYKMTRPNHVTTDEHWTNLPIKRQNCIRNW